jgi:hypothetical protein
LSNSRQQRRSQQRGSSGPPPKRDPMSMLYIGFAVVVVLIIAGLFIAKWQQTNAINAAYATASPIPTIKGGPKPIQLVDQTTIGKPLIKVVKDQPADTSKGGVGQPVDGVTCGGMEYSTLHVHAHLSLFVNGVQAQIPALIGFAPAPPNGCLYWLHTHDATGIIHVEAPQLAPAGGSGYTLGLFFAIWGQPLDRNNVAGFKGPVTAYVNGVKYDGDLDVIPLQAHQQITLEVGTPVVPPPSYLFPPAE